MYWNNFYFKVANVYYVFIWFGIFAMYPICKFRVPTWLPPFVGILFSKWGMKGVCLRKRWGKCYIRCIVKFYFYTPGEWSSGRYIGITLSVRPSVPLSVQIRVRPITFLWFDIGLPYLAHGCITMRRCVAYIHDPDSMLTFDLKVNLKAFVMSSCTTCNFC